VGCRLKAGKSESGQMSIARQWLGNHVSCIIVWVTIKHVHVATRTLQIVTTEMKALTVKFRGNEYASDRCIGKQEIEGFDKVFSTRIVKDCLKEMQTQIGTVTAHPCGGGVEYLHRDPASRRRR
jgi:hypothetical protein